MTERTFISALFRHAYRENVLHAIHLIYMIDILSEMGLALISQLQNILEGFCVVCSSLYLWSNAVHGNDYHLKIHFSVGVCIQLSVIIINK